jgi:pyruvate ferredoxin oxidoreductase gamma subunit
MDVRIRLHGRGGEGVKLAGRMLGRAAFLAGHGVQDAALYGAERRGAPVVAFVRIADAGPIRERGYVEAPDVVVVMDASLWSRPEAGVLDGVTDATLVLVNAPHAPAAHGATRVVALDVARIALAAAGHRQLSATAAAFTAKAIGLADRDTLVRAVALELADVVYADRIAGSTTAAARAFEAAPFVGVPARTAAAPSPAAAPLFVVPRLPAAVARPDVEAPGTSALRTTEGWRVVRPVVELGRCSRCLLCFVLCPEGAMGLDDAGWPVVDYAHCKGCLVCATECPPQAIARVPEVMP